MAPYTEFFSWGSDSHGQLALANSDEDDQNQFYPPQFYEEPKSLSFDILITQISCGDYHAAFISGDGFLFSFGRNSDGQLGVGDPSLQKSSAPLLVDSLPKDSNNSLVQVSCGGSHTAVVMSNGDVYSWGSGSNGATGLNTTQNTYAPLKIKAADGVTPKFSFISCGKKHSIAVDFNGTVFVCGDNSARQLGIQHSEKILALKQVPNFFTKALKVAAGVDHSLILTQEGEIYAAGNNQHGNLGLGHTFSSDSFLQVHGLQNLVFVTVAAGRHSGAITNDNRLFVWGPVFLNENELILPQELRSNKLIKHVSVGEKTTAIIDEDFHLYTWGNINPGNEDQRSQDAQMPQFVESLAFKQVQFVEVGLEFLISLGQDYDQNGQPIQKDLGSSDIQIGRDEQYLQPSQISNNSSSYQQQQNQQDYRFEPKQALQYQSQQQQQPLQDYRNEDRSFKYQEPTVPQQDQYQDKYQNKYEPVVQSKPPLKTADKPLNNSEIEYPNRVQYNNQSLVSSQSKKSAEQKKPQDPLNQDSSFHSSQVAFDRNNSADRFKQSQNPQPQVFNYGSNTNADLYKQIDTLREENFQLKQKQRELFKTLNELKAENDGLLSNADSEIKRMSDFVDKYTQEVEVNKKQLQNEFEERINLERKKTEDLKQKFHQDQNEIETKLDKLQREIETLRQENLQINQSKSESLIKQREQQDQLIEANKQLQRALSQQQTKYEQSSISPQNQTPLQKSQRPVEDRQTTPSQYVQPNRPPVVQQERSTLKYATRELNDYQQYREPMINGSRPNEPISSSYNSNSNNKPIRSSLQQDDESQYKTREEPSKFYTIENKNISQSPYNQRSQYIAPIKNDREPVQQQPQNPQYSHVQQYQPSASQVNPSFATQSRYQPISSPPKPLEDSIKKIQPSTSYAYQDTDDRQLEDYRRESYSGMKSQSKYEPVQSKYRQYEVERSNPISQRLDQPSQQQIQYTSSTRSDLVVERPVSGKENPSHQRGGSNGNTGDNNALNDVKNRLMTMQKNKEELEEKLRNYESKIRQHYNRQ